jgi:TRAP-type C4-dicarboxylate transport system permease large subunit
VHGVVVLEEPGLPHDEEVAVTADMIVMLLELCEHRIGRTGGLAKCGGTLFEVMYHLDLPAAVMLLVMMALPFALFMFLDQLALMLVLIPIYQPLLKLYAFDPIWFWTLFLIVATVGGLTPPFGYVLFALKSAAPHLPTTEIFRASWPFVWLIVLGMMILAIFPDLVTVLPNLTRPR